MKVVSALAQNGNREDVQRAADALKAAKPVAVAKSLQEKDSKAEELQKSLDAKTEELETTSKELEETKKSLAEKETELEKRSARKALVFDKFGKSQSETETTSVHGNSIDTSIGDLYLQKVGAKPK